MTPRYVYCNSTSEIQAMKTSVLPVRHYLLLVFIVAPLFINHFIQSKTPAAPNSPSIQLLKENRAVPYTKLTGTISDARTILTRKQVPVLCYHQVREFRTADSKTARDYIVPPEVFREHMKVLADSGYHTILPDELYSHLASGTPLPENSVMLSFDDSDLEQFVIAAPEMKQHGFKAVFFIMTVSLGRPHYMNKEQVRMLSDEGHIIGSHTWDHHNVKKYAGDDWVTQIDKPMHQLETITGKPVKYFAFPFGLWNKESIPELKKRGLKAAFQLSAKRDENDPLYTIRRIIVPGSWNGQAMLARMKGSF